MTYAEALQEFAEHSHPMFDNDLLRAFLSLEAARLISQRATHRHINKKTKIPEFVTPAARKLFLEIAIAQCPHCLCLEVERTALIFRILPTELSLKIIDDLPEEERFNELKDSLTAHCEDINSSLRKYGVDPEDD